MIKREDRKSRVYQQLAMFLPEMFVVPLMLSFYNSSKPFSHLPLSSAQPVCAPKSKTPHDRAEAIIHMSVDQPAIQEDTHLYFPSLLLSRQDKQLYGLFLHRLLPS